MLETESGRRFLAEHSRRSREDDISVAFEAIARLAACAEAQRAAVAAAATTSPPLDPAAIERLRGELADLAAAIARTLASVSAASEMSANDVAGNLPARMSSRVRIILGAAEEIDSLAWMMRRLGIGDGLCGRLDKCALDLHAVASDDLIARGTREIFHLVNYLDIRLRALIEVWDAPAASGAPLELAARETIVPSDELQVADDNGRAIDTQSAERATDLPTAIPTTDAEPPSPPAVPYTAAKESAEAPQFVSQGLPATALPSDSLDDETSPPRDLLASPVTDATLVVSTETQAAEPSSAIDIAAPRASSPDDPGIGELSFSAAAGTAEAVLANCDWNVSLGAAASEPERTSESSASTAGEKLPSEAEPDRREAEPDDEGGLASDLFADVMALTEEERIALFT